MTLGSLTVTPLSLQIKSAVIVLNFQSSVGFTEPLVVTPEVGLMSWFCEGPTGHFGNWSRR